MGTLSNKYFNAQAVEDALDKGVAAYDNMGQIELVYNGTDIRFNNEVVNFQQIVDYITTDARFCYMVYNNRVLLTSDMQLTGGTRYVFFETSTTDSGLSKNAVVKVYSSDGTAISSISYSTIANENFSNKVSTITDNDKNSAVHYPSNKAVTEITDEIKEDLSEISESIYGKNLFEDTAFNLTNWTKVEAEFVGTASTAENAFAPAFQLFNTLGKQVDEAFTISFYAYNNATYNPTANGLRFYVSYKEGGAYVFNVPNSTTERTLFQFTPLDLVNHKTVDSISVSYITGGGNIWHIDSFMIERGSIKTDYESFESHKTAVDVIARANKGDITKEETEQMIEDKFDEVELNLNNHKNATNPHGINLNMLGVDNATPEKSGLMSASDKSKLDNLINQGSIIINGSGVTKNASAFGFLPTNDGDTNSIALQNAVSGGGTIIVDIPGVYDVSKSCELESFTTLIFGNNVFLNRVTGANNKSAKYPFYNAGMLTGEFNEHISIVGLHLKCNSMGMGNDIVGLTGQRGQIAMCNVKHFTLKDFTILDGNNVGNYNVHVQNFEDAVFENITIFSQKDGLHIGKGKDLTIKHCYFKTNDDAIALNAHDYPTGTSYLGWIENVLVEDIHFLNATGMNAGRGLYMLGGSWLDWTSGMEVQKQGDAVVSNGRIYRTVGALEDATLISTVQPTHTSGTQIYSDGVTWLMAQDTDICYNCGVRNAVFRDIYVERNMNSILTFNFDSGMYSRSYYPNSDAPLFENITLENVTVGDGVAYRIVHAHTPIDNIKIRNVPYNVSYHGKLLYITGNLEGCNYGNANILFDNVFFKLNTDNQYIIQADNDRSCRVKISNSLGNYDSIQPKKNGTGTITILANDVGLV